MTSHPSPILVATGVRKTYRAGSVTVEALRGIDLVIGTGEFLAVMGPSGNGKTTMLNCLSGLDDIDDGVVLVQGENLHAMTDKRRTEERARQMGFIFQSFNLIPVFSAVENVELPLLLLGACSADARRRAQEMLDRVGLADRQAHRPTELSGGEQQRVAVARALVSQPAIVWADEPTGNLDSHTAAAMVDLLLEVHEAGQTLVVVTHDAEIASHAQRLVHVLDGRISDNDTPSNLLGSVVGRAR